MILIVPADSFSEKHGGFIPSVVYENKPGHYPMTGNGEFSEPWVWGKDFEKAEKIASEHNARMGISEDEANEILLSSMFPSKKA